MNCSSLANRSPSIIYSLLLLRNPELNGSETLMPVTAALSPPLLTAELPGLGGRIRFFPEDFKFEKIPAYPPSGTGEFLYLWIEKRDMGAEYFVRQIAKRLEIAPGEVGTAGLKDRRAVTRQMV